MTRITPRRAAARGRWLFVALAALSLCACRSLPRREAATLAPPSPLNSSAAEVETQASDAAGAHASLTDEGRQQPAGSGSVDEPGDTIASVAYETVAYETGYVAGGDSLPAPVPMQSFPPPGYGSFPPPAEYNTTYTLGGGMLPGYAPPACACQGQGCGACGCPPTAWRPPGIGCPWPENEYLCDGADEQPAVMVDYTDWSVRGLQAEDTVVHFDTLDGRVLVEPSNCVCIYAPRFASVRKVSSPLAHEERLQPGGVEVPVRLWQEAELGVASTVLQPVEPVQEIGADVLVIFRERLRGIGLDNADELNEYVGDLLPYENFHLIRYGEMLNSEKARLAERAEAALAWTDADAVNVLIDEVEPAVERDAVLPGDVTTYDHQGNPQMRIVKIASSCDARPGEIVEFTLRFDNVGNEPVGNVTILDNLTTRLEYVPESTTCTLDAEFFATENEQGSLILRWEIAEPLPVGAGGVIHFKCRVR